MILPEPERKGRTFEASDDARTEAKWEAEREAWTSGPPAPLVKETTYDCDRWYWSLFNNGS